MWFNVAFMWFSCGWWINLSIDTTEWLLLIFLSLHIKLAGWSLVDPQVSCRPAVLTSKASSKAAFRALVKRQHMWRVLQNAYFLWSTSFLGKLISSFAKKKQVNLQPEAFSATHATTTVASRYYLALQLQTRLARCECLKSYVNSAYYGNKYSKCHLDYQSFWPSHAKPFNHSWPEFLGPFGVFQKGRCVKATNGIHNQFQSSRWDDAWR